MGVPWVPGRQVQTGWNLTKSPMHRVGRVTRSFVYHRALNDYVESCFDIWLVAWTRNCFMGEESSSVLADWGMIQDRSGSSCAWRDGVTEVSLPQQREKRSGYRSGQGRHWILWLIFLLSSHARQSAFWGACTLACDHTEWLKWRRRSDVFTSWNVASVWKLLLTVLPEPQTTLANWLTRPWTTVLIWYIGLLFSLSSPNFTNPPCSCSASWYDGLEKHDTSLDCLDPFASASVWVFIGGSNVIRESELR